MATSTHDQFSAGYRWYALFILTLGYIFNFVDRQVMTILLEPIKTEFGATDTQMGLLTGLAFALFYATLGVPMARLADRWSRRNVLAISMTVWSAMTALCATASSFGQLALYRIAVGVGEAGGTPPSQSLLADYFPPSSAPSRRVYWRLALILACWLDCLVVRYWPRPTVGAAYSGYSAYPACCWRC